MHTWRIGREPCSHSCWSRTRSTQPPWIAFTVAGDMSKPATESVLALLCAAFRYVSAVAVRPPWSVTTSLTSGCDETYAVKVGTPADGSAFVWLLISL